MSRVTADWYLLEATASATSASVEFVEQVPYAWIRFGMVGVMLVVIGGKAGPEPVDIGLGARIVGKYALQKPPHAVADKKRVARKGMLRITALAQSVVGGLAEILDGVEQGTVKVENHKSFHCRIS